MQLTEEQKKRYMECRGNCCPACESSDISGGHVEINDGFAWQDVDCKACDAEWQDIYTLTSVEDRVYVSAEPVHGKQRLADGTAGR